MQPDVVDRFVGWLRRGVCIDRGRGVCAVAIKRRRKPITRRTAKEQLEKTRSPVIMPASPKKKPKLQLDGGMTSCRGADETGQRRAPLTPP